MTDARLDGSLAEVGIGVAVGADGAVYVTGHTTSADFPTRVPYQPAMIGSEDAFVAEFDARLGGLQFSTFLDTTAWGGSDSPTGVVVGPDGNIHVAGWGTGANGFAAALTPDGQSLPFAETVPYLVSSSLAADERYLYVGAAAGSPTGGSDTLVYAYAP